MHFQLIRWFRVDYLRPFWPIRSIRDVVAVEKHMQNKQKNRQITN